MEITQPDASKILIRKAKPKDIEGIFQIAKEVGSTRKNMNTGFLIDDYSISPDKHKIRFKEKIASGNHFYVAVEKRKPIAFLIANTVEEWEATCPNWRQMVRWRPDFYWTGIKSFIYSEKMAVDINYAGKGIASLLYDRMMSEMLASNIHDLFSETVISPVPNMASLGFRRKQGFTLAGVRYQEFQNNIVTNLVFHKKI
ncbi:MAG TPA: GNAT family N-acetyltransferase [Clostridia bacterium]|nr:GNAT family N-acetyltransferase [Clostridia bacterium]